MPRFIFTLIVIVMLTSQAVANEAKALFDSLYGPRLKQVTATADRADDLALATQLLAAAQTSKELPQMVVLLCEASHDLGQRHPDGYATSVQAMTLLAEFVPEQRDAAREKAVEMLTKQSRAGKAEEREPAVEKLIETLLAMGDDKSLARKWSEAVNDYRRAMANAAQRKSPQLESVKARLEEAMRMDRVMKQVARLEEKLLANANDWATAEEIVKLYVVELDDPASALPMLNRVKSETIKKLLPLTAKAFADLSAEEAMELGEWIRSYAQAAVPQNRDFWVRTEQYLSRFLELNTDTGITFTKATALMAEAKGKLATLKASERPAAAPKLPRNPLIAEDKHFGFSGFERKDNVYTLNASVPIPAARTRLRFKAHTDGGTYSFGDVHVRLNDRDWVKVGEWSDASLKESGKNEHWTEVELKDLPPNATAKKMEVRFQFTKGGWRLQMYEVQWMTK